MSTTEPHRSHLSHKKTILMQETTANADSHHSHKNRQEAEETEGIVGAIPIYVEELLLLLTCYVEGTS